MDRDNYADMFRFQMGQCVRWAESPRMRFTIYQRRWTQREILDPIVQYRFRAAGTDLGYLGYNWVHERDLEAWGDEGEE